MSVAKTAARLGLSHPIVYRLIRDGKLRAFKVGRRTLIAVAEVERLVTELTEASVESDLSATRYPRSPSSR
jgi:excisionase family DNA binding protein